MTIPEDRLRFSAHATGPHRNLPILITCGSMLCELRTWSAAELPESKALALTRIPGLGWVGAVPVECMN